MRDEDAEREQQQQRAEGAGGGVVELRTSDVEVNLRGDDVEAAAQNQRVTEVGERLHEHQQEGVGERRAQQREDNLEEGLEAAGAQRIRGFFNRGVNGFQRAVQNHEGERGEGENLRDGDAVEAVEPVAVGDAEPFGEIAGAAEHQRDAKADDKRRRDNRQNGENLANEGGAARDAGGVKGEGEAENGGHQANEAGEHQRVADDAQNVILAEDAQHLLRVKNAVLIKHRDENRASREDDKERNQEDDDEQRGDDELVALQHLEPGKRERGDGNQRQREANHRITERDVRQLGADQRYQRDGGGECQLALGARRRWQLEQRKKGKRQQRREPQRAQIERRPAHCREALLCRRLKNAVIEGKRGQKRIAEQRQRDPKSGLVRPSQKNFHKKYRLKTGYVVGWGLPHHKIRIYCNGGSRPTLH